MGRYLLGFVIFCSLLSARCSQSDSVAGVNWSAQEVVTTTVKARSYHTCATTNKGVFCWGANGQGELGDESLVSKVQPSFMSLFDSMIDLSVGDAYSCALIAQGMWCWGSNEYAGMGNTSVPYGPACNPADSCYSHSAVQVMGVGGSGVLSSLDGLSVGGDHSCAFDTNGAAYCWGYNIAGQVGDASTTLRATPVQVSGLSSGVSSIDVGSGDFTCAIVSGAVQCWGDNFYGQLGDNAGPTDSDVPVATATLVTNVNDLSVGMYHVCAIWGDTVWCWGSGLSGQVGDGNYNMANNAPTAVLGITSGATQVAAGFDHTCAIVDGGVKCWGVNDSGQLGDGTTVYARNSPVDVVGLSSGVTDITAGFKYSCAVQAGQVYCWGSNIVGQLGVGDNADRGTPTLVSLPLESDLVP